MKLSSLILVGLEPAERDVAITAARELFPDAFVTDLQDLAEFARASSRFARALVVVGRGEPETIAKTAEAVDDNGLPLWAVVALADEPVGEFAGFASRESWSVESARQAFRAVSQLFAVRYENERLRGDLKTVATRFSHDVRSPLGAILTTCELIKELGEAPDATLLRAITDSADEVSRLVEQLTVVLRATVDPKPAEAVDMSEVVFRALQRIQYETHEKKASVTVPEKWPTVQGVGKYLEVVWNILLENALKYGGETPHVAIGWKRVDGDYEFSIEDSGEVPPDLRAKLFQPFHTLHDQNDGGGIALSIVKRIVELHRGRCAFETIASGGSRYSFLLPVPPEAHSGNGSHEAGPQQPAAAST